MQLLKYFIDAELPGLNQSDIEVRINDNILTIKKGKKEEIIMRDNRFVQRSVVQPSIRRLR
ncbi:Hsp20 family protein [Candidatus Megaera venefica]|uniref:Hsp20 family protein n=1 Tax=Candidatus Megaera venefica TaxID=2055910 RepID=UPI003977D974